MADTIKWTGGTMPVPGYTLVEVMTGDTKEFYRATMARNLYWDWRMNGLGGDIVEYRVVGKAPKSLQPKVNVADPVALDKRISEVKGELAAEYKTEIKTDVSLFPPAAVRLAAKAFMAGGKKGGRWPYNWRNCGGPVRRRTYLAAAMRHIQADLDGEDHDAEMSALLGEPVTHIGAAMASLAMLADGLEFGNVIDNRPSTNWEKHQAEKQS